MQNSSQQDLSKYTQGPSFSKQQCLVLIACYRMVQSMTVSFLHTCAQSQLPELLILYIYNNKTTLRLLADLLS